MLLRICYAVSGTGVAYAATGLCGVRYWHRVRLPYAVSGTDIGCAATRQAYSAGEPGTEKREVAGPPYRPTLSPYGIAMAVSYHTTRCPGLS
eukprot:3329994-Rhodomonas_salina.2